MKRWLLVFVVALLFSQLTSAQPTRPPRNRVGDSLQGLIIDARIESAQIQVKDGGIWEGPRTLLTEIKYAADGLSRETLSYQGKVIHRKMVEHYLPDGSRESMVMYDATETLVSKRSYEYDEDGRLVAESTYGGDGSLKEKKVIQANESGRQLVTNRLDARGSTVETSVNTTDVGSQTPGSKAKRSVWTSATPVGNRVENIFEVDSAGNHNDQQLSYASDGSLTKRRVAVVNASVTRLEATEFDGANNVTSRSLETREYDSRGNLIKLVNYTWNASLGKFEPSRATYTTINYSNWSLVKGSN